MKWNPDGNYWNQTYEEMVNARVEEQGQRALFMNHMYKCSGRENPDHPYHGLYTGLWEEFCLNEAGPYCRALHFEREKAISDFIAHQKTLSGVAADCKQGQYEMVESFDVDIPELDCQQDQCKEEFITTFHD